MQTTKRPHRKPKKRPQATRPRLGGLPKSDIEAIMLASAAAREHGCADVLEDVLNMPAMERATVGTLILQIHHANELEERRRENAAVQRSARLRLLTDAVTRGGSEPWVADMLAMDREELREHNEQRLKESRLKHDLDAVAVAMRKHG